MLLALTNMYIKYWWMVKSNIFKLCTTNYIKYVTKYIYCIMYIYIVIYFIYFVVHNLKTLLLTIHQYFIYIFVKASNIQYNQSRILNYTLVLIAAYFTHCS